MAVQRFLGFSFPQQAFSAYGRDDRETSPRSSQMRSKSPAITTSAQNAVEPQAQVPRMSSDARWDRKASVKPEAQEAWPPRKIEPERVNALAPKALAGQTAKEEEEPPLPPDELGFYKV